MTLACEVDNLKLVEVVTVAHVDDEDRVGKSSLQNWELSFGHKGKLFFRLWFEHKVWSRFWSLCLVKILKMKFDQDLCLNLWYELNPRVRCAFGDVFIKEHPWLIFFPPTPSHSYQKLYQIKSVEAKNNFCLTKPGLKSLNCQLSVFWIRQDGFFYHFTYHEDTAQKQLIYNFGLEFEIVHQNRPTLF